MKIWMWILVAVAGLVPAVVVAAPPVAADDEVQHRVAVVALDEGAHSGGVMQTVSGLLDGARFDVMMGDRLEAVLDERKVAVPRAAVASKFSGLANVIADGVEQFFYKGNEAAIAKLSPVFDMGMANPEVLARRPDFADQIYQAGLVMIRAYKNLGQEDNAKAVAQLLVKSLPGLEPSAATSPPTIIRFIKEQRKELAKGGATLEVEMIDGKDCTAFINGSPVEKRPYPVAAGVEYMVTMDCGGSTAPVWKLELAEGQKVVAPVSSEDPLSVVMTSGDYRQRRKAEAYLRLVAFWSGAPRVLGVTRSAATEAEESILFVRVESHGEAVWSDNTDERAISRGLARVLPQYRQNVGDGELPVVDDDAGETDWLGWSLVGGGVAVVGVGTWVALAAENRALEVECSPDTDYGTSAADCDGVTVITFADQAELEQAESEVTVARVAGYGSIAAGLGLASWGLWRLVSPERRPSDAAVSLEATPLRGGAMAGVRWRF
ncbi:hypothetical protein FIV42_03645 [Persicimonas caeni]|uniref:PEGA domain-containing protein n=1 Tax=Persicimonas caeni TaxID=2292766 RepID=A0A4Y6PNK5_PERCE|nr:hypothetical protein [Persicimonas caeni]QDG49864.1 hypothetical protein FIV42_03645 [Persicimonas caeni]QED31085.1 hypothetical protein FRD00_03640 [Persicimonas caeni]